MNAYGEIALEKVTLLPQRYEDVHIAFASDANYVRHMGVAMTSLLVHNPTAAFHFHIIYDSMEEQDGTNLTKLAQIYQVPLYFYKIVSAPVIDDLRTVYHLSKATYYRLLLPYILPRQLVKVLYLDCDLVCAGDIRRIWHIDLGAHALAAKAIPATDDQIVALTLTNRRYLQSGVLLFNLPVWRQQELTRRIMEYLVSYPDTIQWLDQDALAAVLDGQFAELPGDLHTVIDCATGAGTITEESVIIHFAGQCKPWQEWCPDDRQRFYWQYLNMSPWYGAKPEEASTVYHAILAAKLETVRGNPAGVQRLLDKLMGQLRRV